MGVKQHQQEVQGKSWRQGQVWGETLKYQGTAYAWGWEWPGLGMARAGNGNVFTAKSRRQFLVRGNVTP